MSIEEIYEEYMNGNFSTLRKFVEKCSKRRLLELVVYAQKRGNKEITSTIIGILS